MSPESSKRQRLRADGGLGARAADETFDGSVGEHDCLCTRLGTGRLLRRDDAGMHVRSPSMTQLQPTSRKIVCHSENANGVHQTIAMSVRKGLPWMARHTCAGVNGMSAWRTWIASSTELTTAGGEPTVADSPTPFTPSG